jgi:DNA-binding NarL/FixJ family response regulator
MQFKTKNQPEKGPTGIVPSKSGKGADSSGKKRVLVVDDHPIMRQGIVRLIEPEPDLMVCGEVGETAGLLELIERLAPDVVVMDLSLPDKSGLELVKEVRAAYTALPILVYSMHEEVVYAKRIIRMGASGYIMKTEDSSKLIQALRRVLNGHVYVSDRIASEVLRKLTDKSSSSGRDSFEQLSDREFEIFQMIGQGKNTKEIAEQLHLSTKTVEVHRMNIKEKLNLKSSVELIHLSVRARASLK